jgi:hypothetical protein
MAMIHRAGEFSLRKWKTTPEDGMQLSSPCSPCSSTSNRFQVNRGRARSVQEVPPFMYHSCIAPRGPFCACRFIVISTLLLSVVWSQLRLQHRDANLNMATCSATRLFWSPSYVSRAHHLREYRCAWESQSVARQQFGTSLRRVAADPAMQADPSVPIEASPSEVIPCITLTEGFHGWEWVATSTSILDGDRGHFQVRVCEARMQDVGSYESALQYKYKCSLLASLHA